MKKTVLLSLLNLGLISLSAQTTSTTIEPLKKLDSMEFRSQLYSAALGYGNMGFNLKVDMAFLMFNNNKSSTRFYIDANYQPLSFGRKNFTFENTNYPSDVFFIGVGGGLSQEFNLERFTITPLLGLKYYYVRFYDKALVDAIGQNGLERYITDQFGNRRIVGPTVSNGYGNKVSFEVGTRLGFKVTKWLEFSTTAVFTPNEFSTAGSLFGKYWGEAPYTNEYFVDKLPLKLEGNVRFNFGH
ncbi:MAG: hypothetical protein JNL75_06085 [Chitinophagales bacterium]|nr:hypothetical protein [Chitinophagales bacterium]